MPVMPNGDLKIYICGATLAVMVDEYILFFMYVIIKGVKSSASFLTLLEANINIA